MDGGGRSLGAAWWWAIVVSVCALAAVVLVTSAARSRWVAAAADRPSAGHEESATPLGVPPTVPYPSSSYSFLEYQADGVSPVAWDPCRPVHYVVRSSDVPSWGATSLAAAMGQISAATGLRFVFDGYTDEQPGQSRAAYQPGRYGDRWAPVLVAWESDAENAAFAGDVVGQAGPVSAQASGGQSAYVSGQVLLDAASLTALREQPSGDALAQAVIEHELGHLMGLGHVRDQLQLMYPIATPVITQLGAGDLTGLARLGSGSCAPLL